MFRGSIPYSITILVSCNVSVLPSIALVYRKLHPLIAFKLPFHRFNLKIFVHTLALDPPKKQEKEFLINLG